MTDTDNPFKQFAGIDDAKDVQARQETTLEKLVNAASKLIPEFVEKSQVRTSYGRLYDFDVLLEHNYDEMYTILKEIELKDVSFTEDDLRQFIFSNANNDGAGMDIRASQWLGIFTGCLLQLLTERNKEKGKETVFYVNGNGNRFDYLFFGARKIHELFVESFCGDFICNHIASHGGEADLVCGLSLKGNYSLSSIGESKGVVKQVIGISLEGDYVFTDCSNHDGHVHQMIMLDIKGDYPLHGAAMNIGDINQVIGMGIQGAVVKMEKTGLRRDDGVNIGWDIFEDVSKSPVIRDRSSANYKWYNKDNSFTEKFMEEVIIEKTKELLGRDYRQIREKAKELYQLRTHNYFCYYYS